MSMPSDKEAREQIIRIGRLLYEEGLNTTSGQPAPAAPKDF